MFSKKDYYCFCSAIVLILAAYAWMITDPVAYGFGVLTLWIAPPLLLAGLFLVFMGIIGIQRADRKKLVDSMRNNSIRHMGGFVVFIIALCTYIITLEPTASLWDCSEFIASAYKLQVPHSPGGPLFLLIARLFSMLALNDVTKVAWSINLMSAFFSALTVYLTFHLIYYFGSRITAPQKRGVNIIFVLAASCGSLCLTFSDTFWFSAVEAESYAAASFFILLLVWLIVTGKHLSDESRSRRLVLIFYLAGLSYCVHPMCLLALPLLPFCWYVNARTITVTNMVLTVGAGLAIVMVINHLVAVGIFELMFSFDLFFVNALHFPFYSGAWITGILLIVLFVFLLKHFKKHMPYTWAAVFLLVGFFPYAMLFIRSNHNPPIDENNPENIPLIRAYMNRESYGSAPLLYGPYFDAEIEDVTVKNKMYYKDSTTYKVAGTTQEYQYSQSRQTILPRLYSNDENNIRVYRQWTGLKENERPNFSDNLEYLFRFQLGEMYFRYFLFNFAGRESDVQYSSWLNAWDNLKTAVSDNTRNQYWMIPLMLGLAGIFYQYYKNKKDFFAVCIFFLITGVVLALYLNSPPNEPRERDYIYVGSFIAYCVWIGLGVIAIGNLSLHYKKLAYAVPLSSLIVPAWMAYQNFDDHDRSGRTFQIDNARNLLRSCAPNSILFTGGDNDTFPLWYLQDVEGFRTDVRVMVSSYMNTDWYINQLRRPNYKSQPFKLTLDKKDYLQYGPNDALYIQNNIKEGIDAKKYLALLHAEHPALRMKAGNGEVYSILPSRAVEIRVNDSTILAQNHFTKYDSTSLERIIKLGVAGNYLLKGELALLDLLVSNEWQRPVYFNFTSQSQLSLSIKPYLVQEGLVYRLTPLKNTSENIRTDTDLMYKNLIMNADYKNIANPDVYFNYEDYHARMIEPLRMTFNSLAVALLNEGEEDKAAAVLEKAVYVLYPSHLRPSFSNLQTAEILLTMGKTAFVEKLSSEIFEISYRKVKEDMANNKKADELTVYMLQKSGDQLRKTGHLEYLNKVEGLGLSNDLKGRWPD